MNISAKGIALIKQFEGLSLTAYQDSVGVWTIGYGHTRGVSPNEKCDAFTAAGYLYDDLDAAQVCVKLHTRDLTQNQFDALVSFTFNLGCKALQQMLAHGLDQVPVQILRWTHSGGVELPGIVKRREAELQLFNAPDGDIL